MITFVGVLIVVASLPFWLPRLIVALRMRIFAMVNGDTGIAVPGPQVDVSDFRYLYEHPGADGRSRGAVLSDLFWYWLAPGPHVHQEHLEPGERYAEVARTTKRILAISRERCVELASRCAADVLDGQVSRSTVVRLRDLMMPIWAEFYYELVFGRPCPPDARDLIVGNADDVVSALKCCRLRHMRRREALTAYVVAAIERGELANQLPAGLSTQDSAYYLQGAFFNTAVVQSSEAMAHLLLAIAKHPGARTRIGSETDYLDRVLNETLRSYPLFGIAHRITSADIELGDRMLAAGSVLCFSYPEFHRAGYAEPDRFDPDRWAELSTKDSNFIPFGVPHNRPCPARGIAPVAMRVVAREVLERFELRSTAAHTRSLPNRGPCLLVPAGDHRRPGPRLGLMWLRDRAEDVTRSLTQLVLGTYMVLDARRKALCRTYFENLDADGRVGAE